MRLHAAYVRLTFAVGIVLLLLINSSIGFYEERGAGNAVKALMCARIAHRLG